MCVCVFLFVFILFMIIYLISSERLDSHLNVVIVVVAVRTIAMIASVVVVSMFARETHTLSPAALVIEPPAGAILLGTIVVGEITITSGKDSSAHRSTHVDEIASVSFTELHLVVVSGACQRETRIVGVMTMMMTVTVLAVVVLCVGGLVEQVVTIAGAHAQFGAPRFRDDVVESAQTEPEVLACVAETVLVVVELTVEEETMVMFAVLRFIVVIIVIVIWDSV